MRIREALATPRVTAREVEPVLAAEELGRA
jgi:hypothetical protein